MRQGVIALYPGGKSDVVLYEYPGGDKSRSPVVVGSATVSGGFDAALPVAVDMVGPGATCEVRVYGQVRLPNSSRTELAVTNRYPVQLPRWRP